MKNLLRIAIFTIFASLTLLGQQGGVSTPIRYGSSLPTGAAQGSLFNVSGTGLYKCNASPCTTSANWTKLAELDATGNFNSSNISGWQPSGLLAMGDSTAKGAYGGNNIDDGNGFNYFLGLQTPGVTNIVAWDGSMMPDVAQLQLYPLGPFAYGAAPRMTLQDGLNDGANYGSSVNQKAIFVKSHLAVLSRALIPLSNTVQATNGAIVQSGTWVLNTSRIGTLAPTLESNANGSTLTVPITTTGGPIYVQYEQLDGNSGQATLAIDGITVDTLNSGNPGTAGNCICTHNNVFAPPIGTSGGPQSAPLAGRYPVSAGFHILTFTVTGATGSGMGFSFIAAATPGTGIAASTPVAGGPPSLWEGGVTRTETYPSDPTNVYDGMIQTDLSLVQNDGLNAYYVCGLAGDYASFPASPIQPLGCSDVASFYLDNAYVPISTTAYDGVSVLTVVSTLPIPAGVYVGDYHTIWGTTTHTELSNTHFWSVNSISGNTITFSQPGFNSVAWTTTADVGSTSKQHHDDFHPNGNDPTTGITGGYWQMSLAYNHMMKLPGGSGSANSSSSTTSSLNLSQVTPSATFTLTPTSGVVLSNGQPLIFPAMTGNVGPFWVFNNGLVSSAVSFTGGAVANPHLSALFPIAPGTGVSFVVNSGIYYNPIGAFSGTSGSSAPTSLALNQVSDAGTVTLSSTSGAVLTNGNAVVLPALTGNLGPFWIYNNSSTGSSITASGGAILDAHIPSTLSAHSGISLIVNGGIYWNPVGQFSPIASPTLADYTISNPWSANQTFQSIYAGPAGVATSGANINSYYLGLCGSGWNGSAAANFCGYLQGAMGTGTNPAFTYNFMSVPGAAASYMNMSSLTSKGLTLPPSTFTTNGSANAAQNTLGLNNGAGITVANNPSYPYGTSFACNTATSSAVGCSMLGASGGSEGYLGLPAANNYYLSSTTAGVRSWVAPAVYTLPTQYTIEPCSVGLWNGGAAITAGTYNLPARCLNVYGVTYTATAVKCYSDNNGSSTGNVADNSANALLTGAVTATNSWASGTVSGTHYTIASNAWTNWTFVADGISTVLRCTMTTTR